MPILSKLSTGISGSEAKDFDLCFGVVIGDFDVDSLAVTGCLGIDIQSQFELSAVSLSALYGVTDCLDFAIASNVVCNGCDMSVF